MAVRKIPPFNILCLLRCSSLTTYSKRELQLQQKKPEQLEKLLSQEKGNGAHEKSAGGKTPFDTIAEDGDSGSLAHIETGTRSKEKASLTSKNVTKVKELIEQIIDHPNALK